MVFHITNYMKETNVWMIRKGRWMLWGFCGFLPLYRNFYWDFVGRRVVWKEYFSGLTEDDKKGKAEEDRANWGYKPRYEPTYDFSIKARKYSEQTREERFADHPRIVTGHTREMRENLASPKEVRTMVNIAQEHNR